MGVQVGADVGVEVKMGANVGVEVGAAEVGVEVEWEE